MDARRLHSVHRRDGTDQFALERALIVDLLREVGEPHVGLVEQLEADLPARRRIRPGDRDASGIGLPLRHQDRRAAVAQAIGDAALVQLRDDRGGIGRTQPLREHDIVGAQEQEVADGEQQQDEPEDAAQQVQLSARGGGSGNGVFHRRSAGQRGMFMISR